MYGTSKFVNFAYQGTRNVRAEPKLISQSDQSSKTIVNMNFECITALHDNYFPNMSLEELRLFDYSKGNYNGAINSNYAYQGLIFPGEMPRPLPGDNQVDAIITSFMNNVLKINTSSTFNNSNNASTFGTNIFNTTNNNNITFGNTSSNPFSNTSNNNNNPFANTNNNNNPFSNTNNNSSIFSTNNGASTVLNNNASTNNNPFQNNASQNNPFANNNTSSNPFNTSNNPFSTTNNPFSSTTQNSQINFGAPSTSINFNNNSNPFSTNNNISNNQNINNPFAPQNNINPFNNISPPPNQNQNINYSNLPNPEGIPEDIIRNPYYSKLFPQSTTNSNSFFNNNSSYTDFDKSVFERRQDGFYINGVNVSNPNNSLAQITVQPINAEWNKRYEDYWKNITKKVEEQSGLTQTEIELYTRKNPSEIERYNKLKSMGRQNEFKFDYELANTETDYLRRNMRQPNNIPYELNQKDDWYQRFYNEMEPTRRNIEDFFNDIPANQRRQAPKF